MRLYKYLSIIAALIFGHALAQPANDNCDNATRICPNITLSGSTTGATNEGTDYDFCYVPENTVWYVFTTNDIGGAVTVDFTGLTFNPDPTLGQELRALFFQTSGSCGITPYTPMSDCGAASIDFSINNLIALDPNTTYYIQISGTSDGATNPSECDFDITISGPGVERPDPTVAITVNNTTICQNTDEPVSVNITDCSDTVNYEWTYNGGIISSGGENTFSTTGLTDDGTLGLTITCGSFCPKTATSNTLDFIVTPVEAEAGEDQVISLGDQANLSGTGVGVPTWSPGSSLTNTGSLNTVATPAGTTIYYLTMENDGCFATDSVTVFVGELVTIYTSFSPNGDAINDRWHILNSDKFPNMEVNIYDRSGQRVFSAVNYTQEDQWWDGTFKGKDLPTSTYYYVVQLNNADNKEYKGFVNIIR